MKSQLIGKDPDAEKDRRQEEKGMAEDEVVGWHHLFSGHEFEQALGDSEGEGSEAFSSPRNLEKLDMTLSKLWEMVKDMEAWCAAVPGIMKSWTQLSE